MGARWIPAVTGLLLVLGAVVPAEAGTVRAQLDTVGFAVSDEDFQEVLAAALAAEGLASDRIRQTVPPAVAAILPHDDYLYAGRTVVHALPYLQARRWVVFGVCHACRRIGVRDTLLLDAADAWLVAGREFRVDTDLREELRRRLAGQAVVSVERHRAEHSVEALLPWLGAAVEDPLFVPILVPGMEPDHLAELADALAAALAEICRERGWRPGRDLGLLISADAVHYGCEGWGGKDFAPFGCDREGHDRGRARDVAIAGNLLSGPLDDGKVAAFIDTVWNREGPDYPVYPYRVTWCGLYSIPFGLTCALRLQERLDGDPPAGRLLRYGDSVSDGRLPLTGTKLGVTAPNTLKHWVGYATIVYR